jgi:hypothetical protein
VRAKIYESEIYARAKYILEWIEGMYEEKVYTGDSKIESSIFKNLELTVDRLLQAR